MALSQLPEELFLQILDLLPISSMYQIAATCRTLHQRVHANDYFWQRKVRQKFNTLVIDADYGLESSWPNVSNLSAIIQDPTLQGAKELCLISSEEFHSFRQAHKSKHAEFPKILQRLGPNAAEASEVGASTTVVQCTIVVPPIINHSRFADLGRH